MLKRQPGRFVKWALGLSFFCGLISFLPVSSWVYGKLCHFQFTPWVWLSGLVHGLYPENLILSSLVGGAFSLGIPAFTAWILFPLKPLYGEARLARRFEISRAGLFKSGAQSILLGRCGRKLLSFNGDLHTFLAAATGTGKGVGFVVPNLLNFQGSVFVLDIKGENYSITSGYRGSVLGQKVFRFDPLNEKGRTHCFNVFSYIRAGELRITDVQRVASILVPNESSDPYWDSAARDLLVGLMLLVLEAGPKKAWPITIGQVLKIVQSEEEVGASLKGLIQNLDEQNIPLSSVCKRYIFSFCNEPEKPRGSIRSALSAKLALFANPLLDRATSRTDFDLCQFRREPISLYLVISPDDLQRLSPLVRLLVEFFLTSNTKAGETPSDNSALRVPVLMLLDEFLSLGRVDKLVHALSYVRGWGIKVATVIQSEAQLRAVYGSELAEFFIDNHRARVFYRPPVHRRDLAEGLTKLIGKKTVKQTSYSYSSGRRSRQVSETGQEVLNADEISNLSDFETIVLVEGVRPLIGRKLCYYKDRAFKSRVVRPLPLPEPVGGLPEEPLEAEPCEISPLAPPGEDARYKTAKSVRSAIGAISVPKGASPTPQEIDELALTLASVIRDADPRALAQVAEDGI